jgi:hypothetical protein
VPVFGCFLLMTATLSNRYSPHAAFPAALTNMLLSDNNAAIAAQADHSDINSLPAGPLEWSFGRRSSTTVFGAVSVSYTNKTIQ